MGWVDHTRRKQQVEFKSSAKAFLRLYAFLSQVLPYGNANWEKLSIFLNFLVNKLPAPIEEDLSLGVLEAVDMDSYLMKRKAAQSISLAEEDAQIAPVMATAAGGTHEPEMDRLSNIIAEFNKTWGGVLGPRTGGGSNQPDTQAGPGGPEVPERQDELGPAERPGRVGLRPPEADHLDGEVPDGALQGLHGGQGVPGVAQ